MPKWTNIARLSEQQEKAREAAFEAQMLALIATPSTPLQPPSSHTDVSAVASAKADGIHIAVTANGHTTHYPELHTVPTHLRQRILNTWLATPPITDVSSQTEAQSKIQSRASGESCEPNPQPKTDRPRTLRAAIALNLLLPGAGQIYLRQPLLGTAYAIPFLATLTAILAIFIRGYHSYLNLATNGDLLDPGNLESLTHAFPIATLTTLSTLGTILFLASTIHLIIARPKRV